MQILKITEGDPAVRPALDLPAAIEAVDPEVVWRRMESWCAWRWGVRSIEIVAAGGGELVPPRGPLTISSVDLFRAEVWRPAELCFGPLGGVVLDGGSTYRLRSTVGAVTAAPDVCEAHRRLTDYMASPPDRRPGSSSESIDLGGYRTDFQRSPTWAARAIFNSGAADLLRPWRRAA